MAQYYSLYSWLLSTIVSRCLFNRAFLISSFTLYIVIYSFFYLYQFFVYFHCFLSCFDTNYVIKSHQICFQAQSCLFLYLLKLSNQSFLRTLTAHFTCTLWSITAKNTDCSTGPLAHPFAHSLALLTRLLVPDRSLRSRPPLRSLVRSLARSLTSLTPSLVGQ